MTRRRATWLVAAAVLVGAIAFVFWPASERAFYAYLDERRAAGLPTTRDEVRGPAPSAEENGAEDLDGRFAELVLNCGPTNSWTSSRFDERLTVGATVWAAGLSPEQCAELATTAERLRRGIEPMTRALEKPRLVFPVTFDTDGMPAFSHISLLVNVRQALDIPANGERDPERRLAASRALLLLAERIEPGGWLEWVVATTARDSGVVALRRGVESGAIGAGQARIACDRLLARSEMERFRAAGRAETVELIENYRAIVEGRAVSQTAKLPLWKRLERRFWRARLRFGGGSQPFDVDFEPGIAELIVAACRLRDAAAGVPDVRTLTTIDGLTAIDPSGLMRDPSSRVWVVSLTESALRTEAAARLARVALAAAEHRTTHGDFPASLGDLAPMFADGVPLDPFTDAPFVYEKTATGVRIASVGRVAGAAPADAKTLRDQGLSWELKR